VPDLTLTGLRVVLEVARSGSFSAAAERLGYTQSAVSRQVAVTEKAAGAALFERHARGVRTTVAGEALVRHAGKVLDDVAAATQELAGLRDRLAGRLTIGAFPSAASVLVPRAIAALVAAHPGLQVRLTEASTPAQLVALRRGRLEVAVLATGEGLPDYDLDGLRLTELRAARGPGVAVADSHPFAVREWVAPAELDDQAWVVGPRAGDGPEFGAWPGTAEPRIAFTARNWPTRLGLVAAGLGIALVPGVAAEAVPRGVRWIPVRDDTGGFRRTAWAATNEAPGAAAVAMVRALEEETRQDATSSPSSGAGTTTLSRNTFSGS
jgi:DNA-binding transcriptional LysR family regulator